VAAAAPARKRASGHTPHSELRQKPKRSPRSARGARDAVRATPARSRPKARTQTASARSRARVASRRAQPVVRPSGHLIPYAVGRTAVAMRELPDSGLMVRLTRGRAWIGLLSVLLTGIVALNVVSLSLNASQGKIAQQAQILAQENSALRARLAERLSNDSVRTAAESLGMTSPGPADISYRDASGQSVRLTALRLAAGFGLGSSLVAAPVTTTPAVTPTSTTTSSTTSGPPTTTGAPATTTSAPVAAPTAPVSTTGTPGGGVSPG
jgi:hypothetical protein